MMHGDAIHERVQSSVYRPYPALKHLRREILAVFHDLLSGLGNNVLVVNKQDSCSHLNQKIDCVLYF